MRRSTAVPASRALGADQGGCQGNDGANHIEGCGFVGRRSGSIENQKTIGGGRQMADKEERKEGEKEEKIPLAQAFFDNIFLLLVLGIAVPVIFYTIWGLLEIASIPLAK